MNICELWINMSEICDPCNTYIDIPIYIHHRVYNELTIDDLSMWLGSSVDRALHQYYKVMSSNPIQARIFFGLLFNCLS